MCGKVFSHIKIAFNDNKIKMMSSPILEENDDQLYNSITWKILGRQSKLSYNQFAYLYGMILRWWQTITTGELIVAVCVIYVLNQ